MKNYKIGYGESETFTKPVKECCLNCKYLEYHVGCTDENIGNQTWLYCHKPSLILQAQGCLKVKFWTVKRCFEQSE